LAVAVDSNYRGGFKYFRVLNILAIRAISEVKKISFILRICEVFIVEFQLNKMCYTVCAA